MTQSTQRFGGTPETLQPPHCSTDLRTEYQTSSSRRLSTVLLFHGTFTINSLAHLWGTRRFATPDDSRNNLVLAIITLGEGWHNNHHKFMYACQQGIRWWEVDVTYYVLKMLSWLGVARDLRGIRLPLSEGKAS